MSRHRTLFVWGLLMAAALFYVVRTVPVDTDLNAFTPSGEGAAERILLEALRSGPASRTLLLTLSGADAESLAAAGHRFAARLRQDPRFERVENGATAVDNLRQMLYPYRYLLSPSLDEPAPFAAAALRKALERRLKALLSPAGVFTKASLGSDPTGEWSALTEALRPQGGPVMRHGHWFSGETALLFARTRASGLDIDAQQAAIDAIANAARESLGGGIHWQITGPGALAVFSRDAIRADTQRLSLTASLLVMALLLLAYRSWRPLWAGALPLLAAMAAGAAVTGFLFGTLHALTIAFGVTLLGVTLDYPLHFMSHCGARPGPESMKRLWPTLRLGVVTTAVGYLTLASTDFAGLAQLGIFAAAGLVAAAATTRWVLPALFPPGREPVPAFLPHRWGSAPMALQAIAVAAVALAVVAVASEPLPWRDDPASLSPVPESLRDHERSVRRAFGAAEPASIIFIEGGSAEQVLRRSETLKPLLDGLVNRGVMAGYEMAATVLPSAETQRRRQARLPDDESLRSALAAAAAGLPFREGLFAPFLEAVQHSRTLPPLTPDRLGDTPLGERIAALLRRDGDRWYALVPLRGLHDRQALREALATSGLPGARFFDLRGETTAMMGRFRHEALERVVWGVAAIALLLLFQLRSPLRTLRVLIPVLGALAVDIALLRSLAAPLTLFHLITLVLVAGIGIDYALFFSRSEAPSDRAGTLHALLLCAVSSTAVFGILAASDIPILRSVGLTAAIGIVACFVFAAILAPPPAESGSPLSERPR